MEENEQVAEADSSWNRLCSVSNAIGRVNSDSDPLTIGPPSAPKRTILINVWRSCATERGKIDMDLFFRSLLFSFVGPPVGYCFALAMAANRGAELFMLVGIGFSFGFWPVAALGAAFFSCVFPVYRRMVPTTAYDFVAGLVMGALCGRAAMDIAKFAVHGSVNAPDTDVSFSLAATLAGAVCGSLTVLSLGGEDSAINHRRLRDQLRKSAAIDDHNRLFGPHGTCPNCEATIPMTATTCPVCKAHLGAGSTWSVRELTPDQASALEALLGANDHDNASRKHRENASNS